MTTQQAITEASHSIERRDAETLLQHLLGRSRASLMAHPETPLTEEQLSRYRTLTERRAQHVPLQYLTGKQEFYGLELQVSPAVLIPRPETELLVEAVLQWCAGQQGTALRIADVGTGSGAIALALASHLPAASVTAVDLSTEALTVAKGNARWLGLEERILFLASDLLSGLPGLPDVPARFDIIVSNPPYVPLRDAPGLQPEVRDHEPHLALFAEKDGLAVYERLIPQARAQLRPGGLLALEIGFGQQAALRELLDGWDEVDFLDDYAGIARVALARRR